MLLIPKAVQKILDEGRAEGLAEVRAEVREAYRHRLDEAYRRFGIVLTGVPGLEGVRGLPDTPEVRDFLKGKDAEYI